MGKNPIDRDRHRDSRPAREYARVEREQADPITDPKVRAMTRAAHSDEGKAEPSRLRKFLNILRQSPDS